MVTVDEMNELIERCMADVEDTDNTVAILPPGTSGVQVMCNTLRGADLPEGTTVFIIESGVNAVEPLDLEICERRFMVKHPHIADEKPDPQQNYLKLRGRW